MRCLLGRVVLYGGCAGLLITRPRPVGFRRCRCGGIWLAVLVRNRGKPVQGILQRVFSAEGRAFCRMPLHVSLTQVLAHEYPRTVRKFTGVSLLGVVVQLMAISGQLSAGASRTCSRSRVYGQPTDAQLSSSSCHSLLAGTQISYPSPFCFSGASLQRRCPSWTSCHSWLQLRLRHHDQGRDYQEKHGPASGFGFLSWLSHARSVCCSPRGSVFALGSWRRQLAV